MAPEASPPALVGRLVLLPDSEAQVVLGDAEVPGHRPRRPAACEVGEEAERPLARPTTADPLEALVEASLRAVLPLTDEAPHADRQRDDNGAHDVDHIPPAGPVRAHRRAVAARASATAWRPATWTIGRRPSSSIVLNATMSARRRDRLIRSATVLGSFVRFLEEPKLGSRGPPRGGSPPCSGPTCCQPSFARSPKTPAQDPSTGPAPDETAVIERTPRRSWDQQDDGPRSRIRRRWTVRAARRPARRKGVR